jgi:cell wall-associated NlpC family hydrolase
MIPSWAAQYVGLPFRDKGRDRTGLDCWGLTVLVLREQFGVEMPSYADDYVSSVERDEIAALLSDGVVANGWQAVAEPRAGDGIMIRVRNVPWHVGVVLDSQHFLHVLDDGGLSRIERMQAWTPRILGIYRHPLAVVR